jgi:hypothetical protein
MVALLTLLMSLSKRKSSTLKGLEYLCRGVNSYFGEDYSRCTTVDDLRRLLTKRDIEDF